MNARAFRQFVLVLTVVLSTVVRVPAEQPRAAHGRIGTYGSPDNFVNVPDFATPPLDFQFDPAGGMFTGKFEGEARHDLRRKADVREPLLVCVRASGTFRAFFDPKTQNVRGNVTFTSWNATTYALDEQRRGAVDSSTWTADLVRRLGYAKAPQEAVIYGQLNPGSGKGSGAISADKSFLVKWEVTFPADGAPNAPPADKPPMPPPIATPVPENEETGFELVIRPDRPSYVSGQRVTLICNLTRFQRPVGSNDPARRRLRQEITDFDIKLAFRFPIGDPISVTVLRSGLHRGGDNGLWFSPLAPAVPGAYQVDAQVVRAQISSEIQAPPAPPTATARFECSPAGPPDPARLQRILDEFARRVPEHRAEVAARHRQDWLETREQMARTLGVDAEVVFPHEPPLADADYGPYNNFFFHENGYQCSGYVDKTIRFLNRMRFYDPDPSLFVGLNYGPLLRGIEETLPGEIDVTLDPHRAVALYEGEDADPRQGWKRDRQRVLDPWPEQRPKVYTIREFRLIYGQYDELDPLPDPEWRDSNNPNRAGFPTHGGCVYWNLDWEQSPATYLDRSAKYRIESTRPLGIALFSPVVPLVRDAAGKRIGMTSDRRRFREIRGAELFQVPASDGHSHWFLALPQGEYRLDLQGTGNGYAHVVTGLSAGPRYLQAAAVAPGDAVQLKLDATRLGQPLRLASGREAPAAKVGRPTSADGGPWTQEEAVAALRRKGGVLINRDDRRPGRPVISVDFTNLRQLDAAWLRYLRAFPQLSAVAMGGTGVGDEALRFLEESPHLSYLALDGTKITDNATASLARMNALKSVSLDQTAVSPAAIERLRRAAPWLRVLGHDEPLPITSADDPSPRVELLVTPAHGSRGVFVFEARLHGLPAGITPFYVWYIDDAPGTQTAAARLTHRFPRGGKHEVRVGAYYADVKQHVSARLGEAEQQVVSPE